MSKPFESFEEPPIYILVLTYIGFAMIYIIGRIKDFLYGSGIRNADGWVPLCTTAESFYVRRIYMRVRDCFNRAICGVPGAKITLMEKDNLYTDKMVMNMGSYNYLGFAETDGACADAAVGAVKQFGCGVGGTRHELGNFNIHKELEDLVAKFVRCEAAITFGMGFSTNSMNIPALVCKGCLILSDELNHSSLILGARLSGATIRVFKHNDLTDLEKQLQRAVMHGQPKSKKPWRKLLIIVEGIYSMEGTIIKLKDLIRLKKEYKAYLFMDEAHSIGALGPNGGGVVNYWGLENAHEVDVMMGTFTKSFGAAGGYIAGSKKMIDHVRAYSHGTTYATSMPAPVVMQIIASMRQIIGIEGGEEGRKRIAQLAWNTRYFRRNLHEMGFIIYGSQDSPVVPLLLFCPGKIPEFSRECLKRGLAVVVVAAPSVPITKGRARICLSAAHNREMLDKALTIISEVGDLLKLKVSQIDPPEFSENDADFCQKYGL